MRPTKRLLCVTSNVPRWAGDSTTPFVLHLAQDLQALGWRVDILAPQAEQGTAARERLDGVSVERFRYLWPRQAQTVCYHGGALVNLRNRPANLLKLPPLVLAEWAATFRRLIQRRYDLLHTHWILPQGFVGALAAKPLRVPHVLTVHGGDVFALRSRLLTPFKRFSLRQANAVTVNSSATRAAVDGLAAGLPELHRIPMGVGIHPVSRADPRVRQLRQRYRRGKGPLLVFVGRLVEEKGVGDLLAALEILWTRRPEARALLVGEGPHRRRFEEAVRAAGWQDRVVFTGWVQPGEVPMYLAAGDVFVGPSRRAPDGWMEAQGLTFLEAMAAGTPVVATRVGGIVDAVIDGQTGLLVEERAPAQIAAAIARLVEDEALRARLVETAGRQVIERFSREASARAFADLFAHLIARGGHSSTKNSPGPGS